MRLHTLPVSITILVLLSTIFRFADLIENHKKTNVAHTKPNRPSKHSRANKFKWTSNRYEYVYVKAQDPTDALALLYIVVFQAPKNTS